MTMINRNSFEVNGAFHSTTYGLTIYGTVEVTLGTQRKRVPATMRRGSLIDGITAYGITGRYRTGMKAWPGSIELRDGWQNDTVSFGFNSRSGKHRKTTISFAVSS